MQHDQRQRQHRGNYAEDNCIFDENILVTVNSNLVPLEEWYIDSGASRHMTIQREWFDNLMYMKVKGRL
jgi:hypothetical protein